MSVQDNDRYLHQTVTESQRQFVYFQLGAAASAIAFAVHSTRGQPLSVGHWSLGLAVASWALSFFYGLAFLRGAISLLRGNAMFNRLESGLHPHNAPPGLARVVAAELREKADQQSDAVARKFNRQTRALLAGGLFFIVWHVGEMAARAGML